MDMVSPLIPTLPKKPSHPIDWGQLHGSSKSLTIANAAQLYPGITMILVPNMLTHDQLEQELSFFIDDAKQLPILSFPDRETLPYDAFASHQDIISQRLRTLGALAHTQKGILIVPITTLMHRLPPKDFLLSDSLNLKTGQTINLHAFRETLQQAGYRHVAQVMEHGEFSIRGSILDLYPMGSELPYRIDLFDNEIDSIRTFEPDTQRSLDKIEKIELLPAHEFPFTEDAIELFREQWRTHFEGNPIECPIYQDTSDGRYSPGLDYYLPLFFNETITLLDYLPQNSLIIKYENIGEQAEQFWQEIQERYEQLRHDRLRPILPPASVFIPQSDLFTQLKQFNQIRIFEKTLIENNQINFPISTAPDLTINHQSKTPLQQLQHYLINAVIPTKAGIHTPETAHKTKQSHDSTNPKILFIAESAGRQEILLDLLKTIKIIPKKINDWQAFANQTSEINPYYITVAPLQDGFICSYPVFTLITENQLFGPRVSQRRRRKKTDTDTQAIIKNLAELHIGDPVVHIDHGVGRYLGLQTIRVGEQIDEYVTIQYGGKDKLYVPVASLHLINRYSGADTDHAPLNKLGTDQWDKVRSRAAKRARDVAAELLDIYARRAARKGHTFNAPDQNYIAFAEAFPFEETPDQAEAINKVIQDMCSPQPMDRLVCGDVGFGKTEVAMRAAFLAVQNQKQVVILVPTTLLAQQHYENFKDRFANWPVIVDVLSRFRTAKEQKQIIEQLKTGKIDIIIGTHKLLQSDINFNQLGLVIIDEEHRFGVRQKEKLKSLRSEVDILTLTATPIPRTLNLSLSAIRDLSIIATPPEKRLAVKTFISERKDHVIREAILREILRGGQVYYLHNQVATINRATTYLEALIPEARISIAHGQMHERELEHIMTDFYHRRFNVLVCSTIVESGIDIPSANTMIIDRADKFGLAQLHQLRGRVGRSHHQAYTYLLIPDKDSITKDAKKRLEAISALEDLGVGFMLATHDLEIRGAGELLGEEQSGHIQEVGFNLYMEMLDKAVNALKTGKTINLERPFEQTIEINLHVNALIPEDYLPNVHTRLTLYKRIASATEQITLDDLRVEMIDRFGLLPDVTKNLFEIASLKLKVEPLGIRKIDVGDEFGKIEFTENPNIDSAKIIRLIQTKPQQYQLAGSTTLKFQIKEKSLIAKIQGIEALLDFLA